MNDLDVKVWYGDGKEVVFERVRSADVTERGELIICETNIGTRAAFAPGTWVQVECKLSSARDPGDETD